MTKYDEALEAIRRVFTDTSVSRQRTFESLNGLCSEIETMIESLDLEDDDTDEDDEGEAD